MSRDKQIEEMAKYCCHPCELMEDDGSCYGGYDYKTCLCAEAAKALYNAGYRKASDVAMEIFEEMLKDITHGLEIARSTRKKFLHNIEKNNIWVYHYDGEIKALEGMECLIAELKKKYESEGEG